MMLLEIILAAVFGTIIYLFLTKTKTKEEALSMGDGWWGAGQKPDSEEDTAIRPFKVDTSEAEIKILDEVVTPSKCRKEVVIFFSCSKEESKLKNGENINQRLDTDLHQRLDKARFAEPLEDSYFHYGFNSTYLKKVVSYWRNQFSWKKQVGVLNKFPQFKTKIEGIDVHFLHIKPLHLSEGQSAKPLLMIHGWPGSVYELYKIIPLLTDPVNHGLSGDHVFEMVCPSIPGFGFSEAPHKKGFNTMCAARIFYKLMLRLGFHKFYIQGGDYGSMIGTNLAQIAPRHVKGIHLNIAILTTIGFKQLLSILLGQYFPRLFGFQSEDAQLIFPFKEKMLYKFLRESGYVHIQATKPDTVGCALNDSPVGLAAYILEKFSTWTDPSFQNLEDGGLEKKFTLDDLLTNIMIYWASGCVVSSVRLYKEVFGKGIGTEKHEKFPVEVPTGIALFPNELFHIPRSWAQQKYVNIVSCNFMPQGGHFAAFEEPGILAADILQFVDKVEKASFVQ